jgi:hypothetical protein
LKEVLRRVTPVLGMIQLGPMKWATAAAMGRFAEAYAHYTVNATPEIKAANSISVSEVDMGSSFEIMFTNWLIFKELKVRSVASLTSDPHHADSPLFSV